MQPSFLFIIKSHTTRYSGEKFCGWIPLRKTDPAPLNSQKEKFTVSLVLNEVTKYK